MRCLVTFCTETETQVTLCTVHELRIKGLSATWQLSHCSFEKPNDLSFSPFNFHVHILSWVTHKYSKVPDLSSNWLYWAIRFVMHQFNHLQISIWGIPKSLQWNKSLDSLKTANSYQPRIQTFQIGHALQPRSEDWGYCLKPPCQPTNPAMHNLCRDEGWGRGWEQVYDDEAGMAWQYLAEESVCQRPPPFDGSMCCLLLSLPTSAKLRLPAAAKPCLTMCTLCTLQCMHNVHMCTMCTFCTL